MLLTVCVSHRLGFGNFGKELCFSKICRACHFKYYTSSSNKIRCWFFLNTRASVRCDSASAAYYTSTAWNVWTIYFIPVVLTLCAVRDSQVCRETFLEFLKITNSYYN